MKFSFVFIFLINLCVWAQDQITVVGDLDFNSSDKIVITSDDIRKSQAVKLSTLLATVANVNIVSSGLSPDSIFIRGGDSSHVLFLVDGVPFYDVGSIQRTANLALLDLQQIKKIEIIKGSQSVLYGGQALSAVIKIETFSQTLKNENFIYAQAGKNFGLSQLGSQSLITDDQAVNFSLRLLNDDKRTPVLDSSKRYTQNIYNYDFAYLNRINNKLKFIIKYQISRDSSDLSSIDSITGKAIDVEQYYAKSDTETKSIFINYTDHLKLSLSQQKNKRSYDFNPTFDPSGFGLDEKYNGELFTFRLDLLDLVNLDQFKLDAGLSYKKEKLFYTSSNFLAADDFAEYNSVFTKARYNFTPQLSFEAGYRKDLLKAKNFADTHQLGFSYASPEYNLKLENSTGFNPGSLFQQYGQYGNPNLRPEKVSNTTLTVEQDLSDQLKNSLTLFYSRYSNLITFNNVRYDNINKSETKGVEYFLNYKNEDQALKVQTSLGYQEPRDLEDHTWLIRRSLRTASIKVVKAFFSEKLQTGLEVIHSGDRRDKYYAGTTQATTLPSFTKINLSGEYNFTPQVNTFFRAENITRQVYQPVYGFYEQEATFRVGIGYRD